MPVSKLDYNTYTLLSGGSATGAAVSITGGEYEFHMDAASNTGTLSLQRKLVSGAWADVQVFSGSFVRTTTNSMCQVQIDLGAGDVRIAITGGTCSGVNAYLQGVG